MPEDDNRVAVLVKLVGGQLEVVPCAHGLLEDRDCLILALVRPAAGHVLRVAALPGEIVCPVGQRALDVPLRELLIALAQQVDLARHIDMPPSRLSPPGLPGIDRAEAPQGRPIAGTGAISPA